MTVHAAGPVGIIAVLVSLLTARGTVMREFSPKNGLPVLLSHPCTLIGDGRPVLVRYGLDRSSSINGNDEPVENDLRREIAGIMASRWERVLYLAADRRLTYGEVTDLVSDLQLDDPTLHVALLTERQVNPRGPWVPGDFSDLCF